MSGSSNFIQHNPTEANQENDAAFASDSTTTGGIGTDQIMPSPWMNKRWYQDSTMVAAIGAMLANKGYVVSDANLATLISVLTGAFITNNDLKTPLVTVAYSPTPTFPASTSNGFDIVLGGNVTSSTFDIAPNIGQILTFIVTQTAGGGATFVPPASVNGWLPINSAPNSVTIQQFMVKEDTTIWPLEKRQIAASVSFNGLGGVTIISSYNIASVVRPVTGEYVITFTNPMPSANYVASVSGIQISGGTLVGGFLYNAAAGGIDPTANTITVAGIYQSGSSLLKGDLQRCDVIIFA